MVSSEMETMVMYTYINELFLIELILVTFSSLSYKILRIVTELKEWLTSIRAEYGGG